MYKTVRFLDKSIPFANVFSSSSTQFICKLNVSLRKQPIFLNEVLVKLPTDPSGDEPLFHISHIDRVYTLRAESINERFYCFPF